MSAPSSRKDPVQEEPYQRCGHEKTGAHQRVLQGEHAGQLSLRDLCVIGCHILICDRQAVEAGEEKKKDFAIRAT